MDEVQAQYTIQHQAPTAVETENQNTLEFLVPGLTQNEIQRANFYYRYDGEFGYQQQEIQIENGTFTVNFNVTNEEASRLEYYFEITLLSGGKVTYPGNNPEEDPVQVAIVRGQKEEAKRLTSVDYSILSPKPGNGVTKNDVVIALALFYDANDIEEGEFRLYVDNEDVTEDADTSAYYISYLPDEISGGAHTVSLNYLTEDEEYVVVDWEFFVVSPGQASFRGFGESVHPSGQAQLTARNQVIGGNPNNAYTGQGRLSGSYGNLHYSLNGYFTSQESSRLQPQNRFGFDVRYGEWFSFQAGHVYPRLSNFTISGRRVYGINSSAHLLNKNVNLQFIYGELDRKVTNLYGELLINEQQTPGGTVVDTTYTVTYEDQGRGSFKRDVLGARVGFGNPDKFQWGFHALKIKDDTTSLFNIRDYYTLLDAQPGFYNNLSQADRDKLSQNPDILSVEGGSVKPKDNIVAGSDVQFGINNNRIRFEAEGVISALNENIYGGPLTQERAEELGFDLTQDEVDFLDRLSWIIVVNENIATLPIRLVDDESGDNEAEPFFPTSILAGKSRLSFNYPSNSLQFQYRWIGPSFNSLGNSTIRKDVAGFTISDRVNLFSNQIYLTLGYESLNDNVVNNKKATTSTATYRTNVSWYPVNRDLPRISAGFRFRTRDNDVERFNPIVPGEFENAAVQNINITGADTVITPTPRMNTTFNFNTSISKRFSLLDMVHEASISYYNLQTKDEVFDYGGVSSQSVSINITSRLPEISLRTQLGLSFNNTESGGGQSDISIFGLYAGGSYFLMDDKLSINGRIAVTSNETTARALDIVGDEDDSPYNDYYVLGNTPTENDFSTFVLQAGAEYRLNEMHSLIFDANFTNVSGSGNANDRLMQLRYIVRF
ncbi:MAG: hypothetical protein FH748_11645 [Balneolaceae bacterium]|nr:hypothetical protein [Balneolaceae bacterium]